MSDLETITSKIAEKLGTESGLGKIVKLDFGGDGKVLINGAAVPNTVTNEDGDADATIQVSIDDFKSIASGALDPMMAFMTGKMKIQGDMGVAQRLAPLLKG